MANTGYIYELPSRARPASAVVWPVSVLEEAQSGNKFAKMVECVIATGSIVECHLLLTGHLQRHNFLYKQNKDGLGKAVDVSKYGKDVDQVWEMDNAEAIRRLGEHFGPNFRIIHWNEWLKKEEYPSLLKAVKTYYEQDGKFKDTVKGRVTGLLNSKHGTKDNDPDPMGYPDLFNYIFEECAVLWLMYKQEKYIYELYAGERSEPMWMVYKHLIADPQKRFLKHLKLNQKVELTMQSGTSDSQVEAKKAPKREVSPPPSVGDQKDASQPDRVQRLPSDELDSSTKRAGSSDIFDQVGTTAQTVTASALPSSLKLKALKALAEIMEGAVKAATPENSPDNRGVPQAGSSGGPEVPPSTRQITPPNQQQPTRKPSPVGDGITALPPIRQVSPMSLPASALPPADIAVRQITPPRPTAAPRQPSPPKPNESKALSATQGPSAAVLTIPLHPELFQAATGTGSSLKLPSPKADSTNRPKSRHNSGGVPEDGSPQSDPETLRRQNFRAELNKQQTSSGSVVANPGVAPPPQSRAQKPKAASDSGLQAPKFAGNSALRNSPAHLGEAARNRRTIVRVPRKPGAGKAAAKQPGTGTPPASPAKPGHGTVPNPSP